MFVEKGNSDKILWLKYLHFKRRLLKDKKSLAFYMWKLSRCEMDIRFNITMVYDAKILNVRIDQDFFLVTDLEF